MSIFAANKKWISVAQTAMSNAYNVQMEQRDIDFGRQLLSNIRQYRVEQASLQEAEATIGEAQVSGIQTGKQYLQQQFNEPYSRTMADADRQEEIKRYESQAQAALRRFKKQAKTAKTTGYITAIVLGAAGGFLGAAAVAGAAAAATSATAAGAITAAGAAAGAAIGGTVATVGGRAMGADRNYMAGGIQGTTTATIAAGSIGFGAGSAGFGSQAVTTGGTVANGVSMSSGTSTMAQGWSASNILSASYTVFNRLQGDMKYLSQDPQLRVQLRGFA
jgi:hypothetical protein